MCRSAQTARSSSARNGQRSPRRVTDAAAVRGGARRHAGVAAGRGTSSAAISRAGSPTSSVIVRWPMSCAASKSGTGRRIASRNPRRDGLDASTRCRYDFGGGRTARRRRLTRRTSSTAHGISTAAPDNRPCRRSSSARLASGSSRNRPRAVPSAPLYTLIGPSGCGGDRRDRTTDRHVETDLHLRRCHTQRGADPPRERRLHFHAARRRRRAAADATCSCGHSATRPRCMWKAITSGPLTRESSRCAGRPWRCSTTRSTPSRRGSGRRRGGHPARRRGRRPEWDRHGEAAGAWDGRCRLCAARDRPAAGSALGGTHRRSRDEYLRGRVLCRHRSRHPPSDRIGARRCENAGAAMESPGARVWG